MQEIFDREDVVLYAVAGVPRSFKKKLESIVAEEAKEDGAVAALDEELTEWALARLKDKKLARGKRTPASRALWRAYSALSAARYYLETESQEEEQVRELRSRVEALWREVSPLFDDEPAQEP
jgi:hypothetical protein